MTFGRGFDSHRLHHIGDAMTVGSRRQVFRGGYVIGIVKRLVADKGFGFIRDENGSRELFFHRSSCTGVQFEDLTEGMSVSFDEGKSPKGPRAENVRGAS